MIYIGYEERGAPKTLVRLILEDRDAELGSHLEEGCAEHRWGGLGTRGSIFDPLKIW